MGHVVRFSGGRHREVQDLLPWFLAGRLDAAEQELVDAHLSVCADCQAEVRFQRRLGSEIAQLPLNVEQSWARMLQRIEAETPKRAPVVARPALARPSWLGGLLGGRSGGGFGGLGGVLTWGNSLGLSGAAAFGALLAVSLFTVGPFGQSARYHALSSGPVAEPGNVMVIFRPDTQEHSLREALLASHARLVGGPTEADAYILSAPAKERDAALASLRARGDVVTAQPIDPGGER